MKIESSNLYQVLQNTQNNGPAKAKDTPAVSEKQAESPPKDRVRLSTAAQDLLQIPEQPPYEQQRVDALREAIAGGQYQPDTQAIAKKLAAYSQLASKD